MDRSTVLNKSIMISAKDISWCFISDYYDGPIEGLLYYQDKIWKFCCFREDVPEQSVYVILRLSNEELENEIEAKKRFEEMVGTHWSYDKNGEKLPEFSATQETQKEYYERALDSKEHTPYTHQVVAWFNVATSA